MLEQCRELFQQQDEVALTALLDQALQGSPLMMPDDHHGHPATQMYYLDMPSPQRAAALAAVQRAVGDGLTTRGTAGRGLGGFVEAWQEYVEYSG
jgi:hypothetical protein